MRPSGTPPKFINELLDGLIYTTAIELSMKPESVRFLMKTGASVLFGAYSPRIFGYSQLPDSIM